MSLFDFNNFERIGNIDNDIQMNSIEEVNNNFINLTEKSIRKIQIYTPDLEHTLYSRENIRKSLLGFIRENYHAEIQILVDDIDITAQEGHLLIPLAQQISSSVTIKETPVDYLGSNIAFAIFDKTSFIYRPDRHNFYAITSTCKMRANKLIEFFVPAWEHAEVSKYSRQLSI